MNGVYRGSPYKWPWESTGEMNSYLKVVIKHTPETEHGS